MLKLTGERYIPGSPDMCTGNEHIHRYALATEYVKGKRVLDLACGEGYGSHLLSQSASNVVGIDICEEAITHAQKTYVRNNLKFSTGSMTAVPLEACLLFDVIICFEALEHIDDQEKMFSEVKRLLSPNGLFIVSTPNKPVYSENGQRQNPYHLKELDFIDFEMLMKKYFKFATIYGQKTYAASKIFSLGQTHASLGEYKIHNQPQNLTFDPAEDPLPRYFIAIGSDQELLEKPPASYLIDTFPREGYIAWQTHQGEARQHIPVWRKLLKKIFKM